MSVEDDVELQDLLFQTLESNGCLAKIRAQLRASTFLALDEDAKLSKSQPLLNTNVRNCQETAEGKFMFCLVREFLQFFNLDFTISVFEAETYHGSGYKYEGRAKVLQNLGITSADDENVPVLMHLIRIAQNKSKSIEINLMNGTNGIGTNGNASSSNSSFSDSESNQIDKSEVKNDISAKSDKSNEEVKTELDSLSTNQNDLILNQTFNVNSPKIVNQLPNNTNYSEELTNNNIKSKVVEKINKPIQNNNLSSLSDLPPLQNRSYHPRGNNDVFPVLHTKEFKEKANFKELDKLFDVRQEYEEDFMSLEEYNSESKNKSNIKEPNSNSDSNDIENSGKNENFQAEGSHSNKSDSDTSISSENDNSETATSL